MKLKRPGIPFLTSRERGRVRITGITDWRQSAQKEDVSPRQHSQYNDGHRLLDRLSRDSAFHYTCRLIDWLSHGRSGNVNLKLIDWLAAEKVYHRIPRLIAWLVGEKNSDSPIVSCISTTSTNGKTSPDIPGQSPVRVLDKAWPENCADRGTVWLSSSKMSCHPRSIAPTDPPLSSRSTHFPIPRNVPFQKWE